MSCWGSCEACRCHWRNYNNLSNIISLKVEVKLKRKLLDQNLCGNIIFAWFLFAAEDVIISFFTFFLLIKAPQSISATPAIHS